MNNEPTTGTISDICPRCNGYLKDPVTSTGQFKMCECKTSTDQERTIFEKGFEEGYRIARRNYEGLLIGYSKWLEHGDKYGYLKHYNRTIEEFGYFKWDESYDDIINKINIKI